MFQPLLRSAYAYEQDQQLLFGIMRPSMFKTRRFIEVQKDEVTTVKAFEKKYKVKCKWEKITDDEGYSWYGYVIYN